MIWYVFRMYLCRIVPLLVFWQRPTNPSNVANGQHWNIVLFRDFDGFSCSRLLRYVLEGWARARTCCIHNGRLQTPSSGYHVSIRLYQAPLFRASKLVSCRFQLRSLRQASVNQAACPNFVRGVIKAWNLHPHISSCLLAEFPFSHTVVPTMV